jgi:hypothetical protein
MFNCSMCPFFASSQNDLVTHLVRRHRNNAGFIVHCSAVGCGRSFKNYYSFKTHIRRDHPFLSNRQASSDEPIHTESTAESDADVQEDEDLSKESLLTDAAYILRLKTVNRLPQTVVCNIMSETRLLFQKKFDAFKESISRQAQCGTLPDFQADELFCGLDTERSQDKFWAEHFGYVKPVAVELCRHSSNARIKSGYRTGEKIRYGYYVPFLDALFAASYNR